MDSSLVTLCAAGCGFFGNSAFSGMCSQCYKKKTATDPAPPRPQAAQQAVPSIPSTTAQAATAITTLSPPATSVPVAAAATVVDTVRLPSTPTKSTLTQASSSDEEKPQSPVSASTKSKNRCALCRQKVGLLGFTCKCEQLFCSQHRHSDQHQCTFDFKTVARQKLEKDNPVIVADKLNRI